MRNPKQRYTGVFELTLKTTIDKCRVIEITVTQSKNMNRDMSVSTVTRNKGLRKLKTGKLKTHRPNIRTAVGNLIFCVVNAEKRTDRTNALIMEVHVINVTGPTICRSKLQGVLEINAYESDDFIF